MQIVFGLVITAIYFGIVFYFLQLFGRLVAAAERIAERLDRTGWRSEIPET